MNIQNILIPTSDLYCTPIAVMGVRFEPNAFTNKGKKKSFQKRKLTPYIQVKQNVLGESLQDNVDYFSDSNLAEAILLIKLRPERMSV